MKVIQNIELLKRLAPHLEDIETEYMYYKMFKEMGLDLCSTGLYSKENLMECYKTLTTDEAFELLPEKQFDYRNNEYTLTLTKGNGYHWINYDLNGDGLYETIYEKTLLQAIEKMLEYLLDNNLLK